VVLIANFPSWDYDIVNFNQEKIHYRRLKLNRDSYSDSRFYPTAVANHQEKAPKRLVEWKPSETKKIIHRSKRKIA